MSDLTQSEKEPKELLASALAAPPDKPWSPLAQRATRIAAFPEDLKKSAIRVSSTSWCNNHKHRNASARPGDTLGFPGITRISDYNHFAYV